MENGVEYQPRQYWKDETGALRQVVGEFVAKYLHAVRIGAAHNNPDIQLDGERWSDISPETVSKVEVYYEEGLVNKIKVTFENKSEAFISGQIAKILAGNDIGREV